MDKGWPMNKVIEAIIKYTGDKPCKAACDWIKENKIKSLKEAWKKCDRPDWLLWVVGHKEENIPDIILAACDIAASVLHLVPEGEDRPRQAIDIARSVTNGKITNAAVVANEVGWDVASAAANAAWAENTAASGAAYAAANAAWAAASATAYSAAFCAIGIIASVHDAHAANDADVARGTLSQKICDLVRKNIPFSKLTGGAK
jgi:hypothetical protein